MGRDVGDWQQEVYGDVRKYAVPGASREARRDALNEYLQHPATLAAAAPPSLTAVKTLIGSTYGPLATAAWQWNSGYGFTDVPFDLMQDYVTRPGLRGTLGGQRALRVRVAAAATSPG